MGIITGIYGCRCHPFKNWQQAQDAHAQNIPIGTEVKNRCSSKIGKVISINRDSTRFVTVRYGTDDVLESHVCQLINLSHKLKKKENN